MRKTTTLAAAGVLFVTASTVTSAGGAENPSLTNARTETLEEVVVRGTRQERYSAPVTEIGRMAQEVIKLPRSVQVIPEQVLLDQQVYDFADAVRNVGGLTEADGFGGTLTDYLLRGFRTAEFRRNGARVGFGGANQPPIQNIEAIEVIKGPASMLYGQLEPGGVVNIRTKRPQFERRGFAQTAFDEHGKRLASFDLTGPFGDSETVAFRLNASVERSDTFRDFYEIERDFISPSILWAITPDTTVVATYEYFTDSRPLDRGFVALPDGAGGFVIPENIPVSRRFGERFDDRDSEVHVGELSLKHAFSENWSAETSVHYSREVENDVYTSFGTATATGDLPRSINGNEDNVIKTAVLSAWVNGRFETGSVSHQVAFGADFRDASQGWWSSTQANQSGFNIFNPVYGQLVDVRALPGTRFERDEQSSGAFIQDQVSLTARTSVLLGIRYDQTEGDSFGVHVDKKSEFTPQAALLFQPTEDMSLYASYSEGFIPVTRVDTLTGQTFDPQGAEQYEVGMKLRLMEDKLTLTTAVYELTKTNIVAADDLGVFTPIGEVRSRGAELDVMGEVLPGFNVLASYAYVDNEILTKSDPFRGNENFNVAPHTFRFWGSYEFRNGPLAGFGMGLGADYTADRFGNAANTLHLGEYTLVDAGVWYYVDASRFFGAGRQIRLGLNGKNLLDERYFPAAGNSVSRINIGRPRTVIASVGITF